MKYPSYTLTEIFERAQPTPLNICLIINEVYTYRYTSIHLKVDEMKTVLIVYHE